jgi:hypothetical protein
MTLHVIDFDLTEKKDGDYGRLKINAKFKSFNISSSLEADSSA